MMTMTKKLFFLGFLVCLFTAGQVFATARHVVGPGAGFGEYETIQAALDDCINGDTVHIHVGVYQETCTVTDNDLLILGDGSVELIAPTYQVGTAFNLTGTDGVIMTDMTIMSYATGLGGSGVTNLSVSDVILDDNLGGVSMNVADGMFDNVVASNGTWGFWIYSTGSLNADRNTLNVCQSFGHTGNGVALDNNAGASAMDMCAVNLCDIHDNGSDGIRIAGQTTNASLTDNTLATNGDDGIDATDGTSTGLTCTGNDISGSGDDGIIVAGDGAVSGNVINGGASGIVIGPSVASIAVSGNDIDGAVGNGITVAGMVIGAISGNDVQGCAVGINVVFAYPMTGHYLRIHTNCLNNNGVSAMDVNPFASPWDVLWESVSNVGNFYSDNVASLSVFPIPGGANMGRYAIMATNTPTPDNDDLALGETMVVDFVYDAGDCDPFMALKAADFVISYDDALLDVVLIEAGDYLPGEVAFVYDNSTAGTIAIDIGSGDSEAQTASGTLVTVTFEAKGDAVGAGSITVASSYKDMNNDPIPAMSPAMAFSVSDQVSPWFVSTALSGSPTGDDVYSNAFDMTLDFELGDDYCLLGLYYKIDGLGGWIPIVYPGGAGVLTYTGSHLFDISALVPTTGDHTLNLLLYDCTAWGTNHVLLDLAFSVDNTAPATPAFDLTSQDCAEAGWTHVVGVTIDVTTDYSADPTDQGEVQWAYSSDLRLIQPFVASFNVDLDNTTYPGDIVHTLYVQVTDVYGNKSGWGSNSIEYNTSAPDNSLYSFNVPTRSRFTTVNGYVENWGNYGATMYAYSINDGGASLTCDDADWQACYWPIGNAFPFSVYLGDDPLDDGDYEVSFAVQDDAGNVSIVESDVITLDRTVPVIENFVIYDPDGSECSNNWNHKYDLGVSGTPNRFKMGDVSGAGTYSVLGTPDSVGTDGFTYYSGMYLYTSGGSPGDVISVFASVKDNVGNVSDEAEATSMMMWGTTSVGTLAINSGDVWTNDLTANLALTGATSNITHIRMGMSGSSAAMVLTGEPWIEYVPGTHTFDMTGANECNWNYIHLEGKNCSDMVTSVQAWDRIAVDTEAPVIDLVEIRGGAAKTRYLNNPITLTLTENCYSGVPYQIKISEDGTFGDPAKGDIAYQSYTGAETHTFDVGDGLRKVYVMINDRAGGEDLDSATIILDREKPTGVLEIVGDPACGAAAGYTCSQTGNTLEVTAISGDAVWVRFRNCAPSMETSWIAITPPTIFYNPWTLHSAGEGTKCVEMQLKDDAGNKSAWISDDIILDTTPPLWSSMGSPSFTAVPSEGDGSKNGWPASVDLSWSEHTNAQMYGVNWQRTNDYPQYDDVLPTHPPTITSDFVGAHDIAGLEHTFVAEDMVPDIYYFSLFIRDDAGNWSTDYLTTEGQNYFGADFNVDGEIEFSEFLTMANAFYALEAKTGVWNDTCDIGPTTTGDYNGYTTVDGKIDFDDFLIFLFSFDAMAAEKSIGRNPVIAKPAIGDVTISAEIPQEFKAGDDVYATIRVNESASVKALSLTMTYDTDLLEAVSIETGEMFDNDRAVLVNQINGSTVNIDGAIFGQDNQFESSEIAVIKFRALQDGSFEFSEPEMDLRDFNNNHIDVAFSSVYSSGALPEVFSISQNYPNPFNPTTTIDFALAHSTEWRVEIFNIVGQSVMTFSGNDGPGMVNITWDGSDHNGEKVASGIYFYRASANNNGYVKTQKMVLMK
ncbi:MAG: cohesin domain-containing protein [candidate division Zixibacteria bacterium]